MVTNASILIEIIVPPQNGLVSRWLHMMYAFEGTLHLYNTLFLSKFQHAPAALLLSVQSERDLVIHCHLVLATVTQWWRGRFEFCKRVKKISFFIQL